jgi:hypothetical protein
MLHAYYTMVEKAVGFSMQASFTTLVNEKKKRKKKSDQSRWL